MRSIVDDIIGDVEGGKTLSSAFRKYPEVFDAVVIAFIDAGEASGTLDGALKSRRPKREGCRDARQGQGRDGVSCDRPFRYRRRHRVHVGHDRASSRKTL